MRISNMGRNVMGKILGSNMKSAIALKRALGNKSPLWMENVAKKYVANKASQKMKKRRNITNLVTLYRRGTRQNNENAYKRMNERLRTHDTILNEALSNYYRSNLPKRNLTNRNVGIIFSKASDAAIRAFIRARRRRQNTTLGRKLYVVM